MVLYLILAPYNNEQSDLIHRTAEEKALEQIPLYRYCYCCIGAALFYICKPFLIPMWEIFFLAPMTAFERPGTERKGTGASTNGTDEFLLLCSCPACSSDVSCCQCIVFSRSQWETTFESQINRYCFKFFNFRLTVTVNQLFWWVV